jgi:hypothetical protein
MKIFPSYSNNLERIAKIQLNRIKDREIANEEIRTLEERGNPCPITIHNIREEFKK